MDPITERSWWQEARTIAARHARRGASDAAEDLAQDLAVAALERGANADRPGAWLERVGRNATIDRWRGERRRAEKSASIDGPAAPPDPEEALLARERRGIVRRALLALPRPQRQAALLRFACELPFQAVAARLGTEPATARTRVHRALARLRARVEGLRALLPIWRGAQATALGLGLLAATAPPAARAPVAAPPAAHHLVAKAAARVEAVPAAREPALPPPAPVSDKPVLRVPAVQVMVFGADLIEGNVRGPDGELLTLVRPAPRQSLIELRRDFVPEMVKSLEEL